jgi:broad specificity phosphatase PhoE|tara:strand:+ start:568 stop:1266 length:699 start_codon:yes stop_codon:yes gene_type:complete
MEIVLIRHGQPNWVTGVNAYTADPKLTDLGRLQSEKSSTVFDKSSVDELWVSPLTRAQETHLPFKDKSISKKIHVFKWLKEMEDEEEKELFGKSQEEVMDFFEKRNTQSFEEWIVGNHGQYMEKFRDNIILNLESELEKRNINPSGNKYDRLFDLNNSEKKKIMIISHAGTMSVLISYFLNMPLYPWTWRKFLPRHAGHTILKSTEISSGHFFRLKEFNNVSFLNSEEEKTY